MNDKFEHSVDWQLQVIESITLVLGDESHTDIVVREIRHHQGDSNSFTFVYTNESLPKDHCPEVELEEIVEKLYVEDLNKILAPQITVKSVKEQYIGNCKKHSIKSKVTIAPSKNFPPVPRNQVDRVNATVGQLLIFRVPSDTFYDPEDENDLKLSLLSMERAKLDVFHWLQFDSKNREFYGVPKPNDVGQKEYLLVAQDREGLTAADALVVVVNHSQKKDYSVLFDFILGIPYEQFNRSKLQRRFIEGIAKIFGDQNTEHILVRGIRRQPQSHNVVVTWYNTTLYRSFHKCPSDEIEKLREIVKHTDSSLRDRVREILGSEFNLIDVNLHPVGACQGTDTIHHEVPIKENEPSPQPMEDYLLTFILPMIIILVMLLLATAVACLLHKRRLTGKIEMGK